MGQALTGKFIQRGSHWWNRGRESYCYSAGLWLYYSNPIVSGLRVQSLAELPAEIQSTAVANHQLDSHWSWRKI